MNTALLLIAFGFGFKIFSEAESSSKKLKSVGRLVGLIIMFVSLFETISALWSGACGDPFSSKRSLYCPMHGGSKSSTKGMPYFVHPPIPSDSQTSSPAVEKKV